MIIEVNDVYTMMQFHADLKKTEKEINKIWNKPNERVQLDTECFDYSFPYMFEILIQDVCVKVKQKGKKAKKVWHKLRVDGHKIKFRGNSLEDCVKEFAEMINENKILIY